MLVKQAKNDHAIVALIVHFFGPQTDGDVLRRYQYFINDDLCRHVMDGGVWTREWAEKNGPLKRLPYLLPILGHLAIDGFIILRNGESNRIVPKGPRMQPCMSDRFKLQDIQKIELQSVTITSQ